MFLYYSEKSKYAVKHVQIALLHGEGEEKGEGQGEAHALQKPPLSAEHQNSMNTE